MNDASLYNKSNTLQKRDAQDIVNEFSPLFKSLSGVADVNVLDVGCGSGNNLVDVIIPKFQQNRIKVVGTDISDEMIRYATEKYQSECLRFVRLDFGSDFLKSTQALNQIRPENFNLITSFYALHWMENQSQVISNIYKLLKPNGKCLLGVLVTHQVFDSYLNLSRLKKYAQYMADVKSFISPYHFDKKPLDVFRGRLEEVGFKVSHIEIKNLVYTFDGINHLRDSAKSVNPFTDRMPIDLQDHFLNDILKEIEKLSVVVEKENRKIIITNYKLMVVVAVK